MSLRLATRVFAQSLKSVSARRAVAQLPQLASLSPRLFSTSAVAFNKYSTSLSETLREEIKHENTNSEGIPADVTAFVAQSGFNIVDTEGQALAKLQKESGDEIIHVYFDVNQVVNVRPSEDLEGLEDPEELEDPYETSYINLNVVVEKKSEGSAVSFDVLVGPEDGSAYIESVIAYENKADALTESAEADQKRELSYNGPSFTNLDEKLQENFEQYLISRGVNEELYQFVLNFGIYKENQEYIAWLEKLNKFFK